MKVAELTGAELDYWVAKAEGEKLPRIRKTTMGYSTVEVLRKPIYVSFKPSTRWQQGGPLIEKYTIELRKCLYSDNWFALMHKAGTKEVFGETPLIAICRCIVASKYGEEVNDS